MNGENFQVSLGRAYLTFKIKMASFIATAGGALLNALAFSGTNFFFSSLSDHGAAERKRHDLALEDLQKARDKWMKDRQERLDFINDRIRSQNEAASYLSNMDEAMKTYFLVTKQRLPELPPEPKLSDFYHPSEGQKTGEILFITSGLAAIGYLVLRSK